MISQKHRFRGHRSVSRVRGQAIKMSGFRLYVASGRRTWRAAVVVSKKVHKSAVVRNRIRRRIYEQFRIYDQHPGLPNADIVCVVYDSALATISAPELQAHFQKAFQKLEQLNIK